MVIKRAMKSRIHRYPRYCASSIINKIERYQYISFDIFDTLVKRNVSCPENIFDWMGCTLQDNMFRMFRVEAEQKARQMAIEKGKEEVTIREIYDCMPENYRIKSNELIKIENDMEIKMCCTNPELLSVYQWCLAENKTVIITSDMYLDKSVVEAILEKCGYTKYFGLYLSSELGLKKKTGSIYKKIIEDLKVNSHDIIHVGDAFISDYKKAKENGYNTMLIARNCRRVKFYSVKEIEKTEKKQYQQLMLFVNHHIRTNWSEYYQFGYEAFGPLLYGFSNWMLDDIKKKNIQKVFFFSRDGYIMQKAFNTVSGNCIESKYIYVSRRSLRVPQLWMNTDLYNVVDSFPQVTMLSIQAFAKNIGLDINNYREALLECNIKEDTVFKRNEIMQNEALQKFYQIVKEDMIHNSRKEFDLLIRYLKQQGFSGEIAVVDIGWYGSLQYFLQKILEGSDIKVNMHGYYIGLTKEARKGIDAKGYVEDLGSPTHSCDSWRGFSGLIEYLFLAQEGSTKTYCNTLDNKVVPILYEYEYGDENKKEVEAIYANEIQQGAISFIEDFMASTVSEKILVNSRTAFANLRNAGNYPNKHVLNLFSKIRFLEETPVYLAKPDSILTYVKSVKKFKKSFYYSKWKIGFLKNLIKIPLPYKRIYELAKRI